MVVMRLAGAAVALMLLGVAPDASAGRAQQCKRTCRDVIAAECGDRLGLPRPDRACRRDMLRQCKRENPDVCTYPILVGSWRYDLAVCTKTCEGREPKDCLSLHYLSFIFLQKGTRLEETQRSLVGWFTDHASFLLEGRDLVGNTATLSGTMVSSSRLTNVAYDAWTTHPEDGVCHLQMLGELVR